ncbi:MAG: trigger factor [Verrucomicrobiales bacterium]|nr:trigger factor [Verrucomicrobiales bacterium]
MNINVEHQPNCRAVIHLHATAEDVRTRRKNLIAAYSRQAKLPGFRPGKVPASVIEKRYGDAITQELERELAGEALNQAVANEGLELLHLIGIDNKLYHDTDGSFSADVTVNLTPKFELPDYKGIPVKLPRVEVTEADIDHDLLHLREHHQSYEIVDRAAQLNDVVVASFTVTLDGQPVGEVLEDAPDHLKEMKDQWFLLAKEDDFLPGFYAGLEGAQKGETREISVTLAEDFAYEPLQGKTLVLNTEVAEVREKRLPELDEAFIQKIGGEEMTEESLRQEVQEMVRRRREQARDVSKTNQVLEFLASKLEFELPQEMVNQAAQSRTNEVAQRALQQGVSEDDLVKNQDAILGNATQQARQDVKISFILGEVAKKENLRVTEGQIQMALANMAARQREPVKKFLKKAQEEGIIDRLREDLLLQNAIAFLKDQAAVEETEPEAEHCDAHGHGHDHDHAEG